MCAMADIWLSCSLVLLVVTLFTGVQGEYHCGIGPVSKALSQFVAAGCDSETLSERCCKQHDDCYGEAHDEWTRSERWKRTADCDEEFKQCIWYLSDSFICRNLLYLTHGKLTQWYNNVRSFMDTYVRSSRSY